jgi:hypothetical protein
MLNKIVTTFLLISAGTVTAATDHLWRQSADSVSASHLEELLSASLSQEEALLQDKLVNNPISPEVEGQ